MPSNLAKVIAFALGVSEVTIYAVHAFTIMYVSPINKQRLFNLNDTLLLNIFQVVYSVTCKLMCSEKLCVPCYSLLAVQYSLLSHR